MAKADVSNIDSVLGAAVDRGDVAGAVAIAAKSDGVLYEGTFGKTSRASEENLRLDSIFRIASMTKAMTSVAAMQLVEQGAIDLDAPVSHYIPAFADLQVLDGLDEASNEPRLRNPATPVTPRQLLSHTAGFGYEIWNPLLQRAAAAGVAPSLFGDDASFLDAPLVFDPGSEWQYGINTDWLGRLVEVVYGRPLDHVFRHEIFEPLGLKDTFFNLPVDKVSRLVASYTRQDDGSLVEVPLESPPNVSFFRGGDGLFSTAADYARFVRALLNGGELDGARILESETVAQMGQNQIGDLKVGKIESVLPPLSNSFEFFPGSTNRFGLGFLLNGESVDGGRAANSLTWAGLYNSFFWIDPTRDVCAVLMMQVLPFYDAKAVGLLEAFEREIYTHVRTRS